MPLNLPSGNMFKWAAPWNPFGGICFYNCFYCYFMQKIGPWTTRMAKGSGRPPKYTGNPTLIEKELQMSLKTLGTRFEPYIIFIQDNGDIMSPLILTDEITRVYSHCKKYEGQNAGYLTLTKNPARLSDFIPDFPESMLLGITLETNEYADPQMSRAPSPEARYEAFRKLKWTSKTVSIEPIMDFDLEVMVRWLKAIKPRFVSIGANSIRKIKFPDPTAAKTSTLIQRLEEFTEVRLKKNLNRILTSTSQEKRYSNNPHPQGLLRWC